MAGWRPMNANILSISVKQSAKRSQGILVQPNVCGPNIGVTSYHETR